MAKNKSQKPPRPWRVVAEEASREYDTGEMADLLRELNRALEEQGLQLEDYGKPRKSA